MMNTQLTAFGSRKGKQNAWRRMLSSVANNTLHVFPVPGLDVLLAKGFNPHQKGIAIAPTPRHANVLLVTSPLSEALILYVANVYAQMPRPRLLVLIATNSVASLPPADFILSVDELNHLHQKISFTKAWTDDAVPYELPSMEEEGKDIYTCPMHPEVQSDKPGNCPKCGMVLIKKETSGEQMIMPNNESKQEHSGHSHEMDKQMHRHEEKSDHQNNKDEGINENGKSIYTCPMHPEVQSDVPGSCPKCGMTLVKKEPEANLKQHSPKEEDKHQPHAHMHEEMTHEGKTVYTCPMHPDIQSNEPGNCPKCGMTLVKQDEAGQHMAMHGNESKQEHSAHVPVMNMHQHEGKSDEQVSKDESTHENDKGVYTCPMHPEVQSDTPGNCPICGMNLVKQENNKQHMDMPDEHDGHQMKGHDMDNMGGDFMSMMQMTKDIPRSEDGLAMEMNDASFGPFHPGLPGGLLIKMKLDGDTVIKATVEKGIVSRNFLQHFPKEPALLTGCLSQLNPLLHYTYAILVHKAISNAVGKDGSGSIVALLEKDRIASHLNWLGLFSKAIGGRELHYRASQLCFAWQSDRADTSAIQNLIRNIKKTPYIKRRLAGIEMIPKDKLQFLTGPVARAAGLKIDARLSMPAYQKKNFEPVVLQENNVWGCLLIRLAEIEQSITLISNEDVNKKNFLPERMISYETDRQLKGEAVLEAPNGRISLQIELEDVQVKALSVQMASAALAGMVPDVTKGKELANALVSVAALAISPWEVDVQ